MLELHVFYQNHGWKYLFRMWDQFLLPKLYSSCYQSNYLVSCIYFCLLFLLWEFNFSSFIVSNPVEDKLEYTKGAISNPESKKDKQNNAKIKKHKWQAMIHKTLHRKLKIEQK